MTRPAVPTRPEANRVCDPGFSWEEARATVREDGGLLRELVEAALVETEKQWNMMQRALADRDSRALRLAAHSLKGSVRYFGETEVYREALRVERCVRDGNVEWQNIFLDQLGRALEMVRQELTEYIGQGELNEQ